MRSTFRFARPLAAITRIKGFSFTKDKDSRPLLEEKPAPEHRNAKKNPRLLIASSCSSHEQNCFVTPSRIPTYLKHVGFLELLVPFVEPRRTGYHHRKEEEEGQLPATRA